VEWNRGCQSQRHRETCVSCCPNENVCLLLTQRHPLSDVEVRYSSFMEGWGTLGVIHESISGTTLTLSDGES
jgi:hypothetical protein